MLPFLKKTKGFTIAELMISVVVLGMISTFAFSIYTNFFDSVRDLKAANLINEEARFVMERIVKEVRNGTIDYEEYFNQSSLRQSLPGSYDYLRNETYADDYCRYSRQFYDIGGDGELGTLDDESTGARTKIDPVDGVTAIPPAIGRINEANEDEASPIQNDLFLININGDERSYIKRIEKEDANGNTVGKIGLLKMEGRDFGVDHLNAFDPKLDGTDPGLNCVTDVGEGDGRIDTWLCSDGFPCVNEPATNIDNCDGVTHNALFDPSNPTDNSFLDITPSGIDVLDLKFIVSPMDDPRKAYDTNAVQIQPHVTVRLTVRSAPALVRKFNTESNPSIVLESTISARVYNEIITECDVRQCVDTQVRTCPLTAGVCGLNDPSGSHNGSDSFPATQQCVAGDFIWPGCDASTYDAYALANYSTNYEEGSEYASCNDDYLTCTTIPSAPCGGVASCCAGLADSCRSALCSDGFDNDCSGAADSADSACSFFLCTDGAYDASVEAVPGCIDVGGLCESLRPLQTGGETSCNDGHDNDCDGFADQFDADCVISFCSNSTLNPNGDSSPYLSPVVNLFFAAGGVTPNYLLDEAPATDAGLNECSPDVGGICELCTDLATGLGACECGTAGCSNNKIVPGHDQTASESGSLCYDNLDNDCDGAADELDPDEADCVVTLCENLTKNCELAPNSYTPADILTGYSNTNCTPFPGNENDELCADVGGICNSYVNGTEDHAYRPGGEISGAADDSERTNLCNDGLNNDCDLYADWQDNECCTSADGDAYPGDGAAGGNAWCTLPLGVTADCDDTDPLIFPGAAEVCDNVADNDCDGDDDATDTDCCVDNDGDSYGIPSAYTSCLTAFPDCNDSPGSGFNINPGLTEGSAQSNCFDESGTPGNEFPSNNDCGFTADVPRANHPDWYRDKDTTWLDWYDSPGVGSSAGFEGHGYAGAGGRDMALTLNLFEPACCTGTIEVCNDNTYGVGDGSDEDCNGREGSADDFCVSPGGDSFTDYFRTATYINATDGGIDHQLGDPGLITLNNPNQNNRVVTSEPFSPLDLATNCPTGYDISLTANLSMPGAPIAEFQISEDGGATWCSDVDCTGSTWTDSSALPLNLSGLTGSDVSWRGRLSGDSSNSPSLEGVTLTYSNCS